MPNIEEHRVIDWGRGITHLAQRMKSVIRMAVDEESIQGKRGTIEQLEKSGNVNEVLSRHQPTLTEDPDHRRVSIVIRDFTKAAMVDDEDVLKILNDPKGRYSESLAAAFGRDIDDRIFTAMYGATITGEDGTTSEAFDTSVPNGTTMTIAAGGAGMTVAKWRQARRKLEEEEEFEDSGANQWYIAFAARQRDDLYAATEYTSSDFATVKALVNGQATSFLGMIPLGTQGIPKTGNDRECPAWVKSGVVYGIGKDPTASVDRRPDLNNNWQILYKASYGASRIRQSAVVQINCDES